MAPSRLVLALLASFLRGAAASGVAAVQDLALGGGVTLAFEPAGNESARFTVRRSSDFHGWLAFGFAQGDAVSMSSGGRGSDVFVCTGGQVRRYWVTSRSLPGSSVEVADSQCTQANGATEMTFTRTLAAGSQEVAIVPGAAQAIYAFGGPGETTVRQHTNEYRGGARVDYFEGTADSSGAGTAASRTIALRVLLALALLIAPALGADGRQA